MADEISGQVTEGGNAVENAIVIAALQEEAANLSQAQATELQSLAKRTDANGEYTFQSEELFTGSENYHVVAHKDAGNQRRGQQNYPYVEAGTAIPDSVVIQNFATTWSQGDGTWVDDATDDGSQDVALTGDFQAGTLSDGSEAIVGDGSDEYGLVTLPSELEGGGLTEWAVEFTFETQTTLQDVIFATRNDDQNQVIQAQLNRDEGFNSDDGNILFYIRDDGGNDLALAPSTNPNLNDGQRHDISVSFDDTTTNSASVIIDGSGVSLSFGNQNNPDNFTTWDYDCGVWVYQQNGTLKDYFDGKLGADRWHDSSINSQTISDYP